MALDAATLDRLQGLDDPTSLLDVREVYLPLTRLLSSYVLHTGEHIARPTNWKLSVSRTPFVIGIAGSMAVGQVDHRAPAATAGCVAGASPRIPGHHRRVPAAERGLRAAGLMTRKGFPESYDRRALPRFVMDVKSGKEEVAAPVYNHLTYDIVPDASVMIRRPDIVILEGLNVLQPARMRADGTSGLAVSGFFDFSVYVDADDDDVPRMGRPRFLALRDTAFRDPRSYFTRYADLTETRRSRV